MILKDIFNDEVDLNAIHGELEWEPTCDNLLVFNKEQVETLRDYLTSLLDNRELG